MVSKSAHTHGWHRSTGKSSTGSRSLRHGSRLLATRATPRRSIPPLPQRLSAIRLLTGAALVPPLRLAARLQRRMTSSLALPLLVHQNSGLIDVFNNLLLLLRLSFILLPLQKRKKTTCKAPLSPPPPLLPPVASFLFSPNNTYTPTHLGTFSLALRTQSNYIAERGGGPQKKPVKMSFLF